MIPVGICYRSLYLKKILIQLEGKVQLNELIPLPESRSIGRINTLFSLFHQDKERDSRSRPVLPNFSHQTCLLPATALAN
jgi:hypothetical protein